ncbi:MAG: tetratricopeptide repeat protein [Betaproteobacteria bacterium]|jgi:predicted negative regulator of RcsB-dependent stress response
MATPLDLQEQEQLDAIKSFWTQYGNLITWILVLVLGGFAAWNGWNWYQRDQGVKAGAMFDELDRSVRSGDVDRSAKIFADLQARYPAAKWTAQGGLMLARLQIDKGQSDAATAVLRWLGEKSDDEGLRALAALRLAGLELDAKRWDEALKALESANVKGFEALAADRRGDVLLAQGKPEQAAESFLLAWRALPEAVEYRRVVEAKLNTLGVAPAPAASEVSK